VRHAELINGKTCYYSLCEMCAKELFGSFEKSFSQGVASGLLDEPSARECVCPSCGTTFSDFQRTGLLGCPSCYDVFREELLPYIAKIQGKVEHIGKSGEVNTAEHEVLIKLSALQTEMESALEMGDYARVDAINRQINALKKKPKGGWKW